MQDYWYAWHSWFTQSNWSAPQQMMGQTSILSSQQMIASLLLSIALAHLLALCYQWTYQGLSYQRRFVYSLTLLSLTACVLMLSMGQSISLSLGVLGTMAMVRFRSNIRELWDMSFVFAALSLGIACGTQAYRIAIMGCFLFVMVSTWLAKTHTASQHRFDGVLRFWRQSANVGLDIEQLLRSQCHYFALISLREAQQGDLFEYSYQIRLKKKQTQNQLLKALYQLEGVGGIQFLMQDEHLTL